MQELVRVDSMHSPKLDTMLMVEKRIVDQLKKAEYPTRTELWRSLPKGMEYQTFKQILDYLEASNKIMYDKDNRIIWVAADNPKLKQLFERSVRLR
jgi:hypothetical protein